MIHKHWCEIRGHWFEAECDHEEGYVGTKEDSEQGYPVELRSDCPMCAGFHWFKITRWLGFFWRYWICSRLTRPYWVWRIGKLRCLGCGARINKRLAYLYSIFHFDDYYVCENRRHFPRPDCGPDCKWCQAVDEGDLKNENL